MSLYRDKAVVLRTYDLREADRIIVMMTENYGKVEPSLKAFARQNLSSAHDLSHSVTLMFYFRRLVEILT